MLPERSQFDAQAAYAHATPHELRHATGHPQCLSRSTRVNHGAFDADTYAGEEFRADIAAMMTGDQLGVGHEPRHGTAYVSSRIKAPENDPLEIRPAAVDAQRISKWLMTRERERSKDAEWSEHEPSRSEAATTREPNQPDRSEVITAAGRDPVQTDLGVADR